MLHYNRDSYFFTGEFYRFKIDLIVTGAAADIIEGTSIKFLNSYSSIL